MTNPTAKPSGNSLARALSRFWHSSPSSRILAIFTPLVAIASCLFIYSRIIQAPNLTPTETAATISTSIVPLGPTGTSTPLPTILLASTWTPVPSVTPSPTPTWLTSTPLAQSPLRVRFLDVGQGSSILIQTPYDQVILIDGGDANSGILATLKSYGVQRIDLLVATNSQPDAVSGLVQVLQALPVARVVANGGPAANSVYQDFLNVVAAAQVDYIELERGDDLSLDGITFHCLNPLTPDNADPNDNSLVLQFAYENTTFLLMSDAGAQTEYDLLASGFLSQVDILQVGQHGSANATTSAFLNTVRPAVAIYSAGLNNEFGYPDPHTLARLAEFGATVYGTDRNGTVNLVAVPSGYIVSPSRN
jgi:competence protein ComEC